jgi:hypothetical protein
VIQSLSANSTLCGPYFYYRDKGGSLIKFGILFRGQVVLVLYEIVVQGFRYKGSRSNESWISREQDRLSFVDG